MEYACLVTDYYVGIEISTNANVTRLQFDLR